jgi:hypothetical protein
MLYVLVIISLSFGEVTDEVQYFEKRTECMSTRNWVRQQDRKAYAECIEFNVDKYAVPEPEWPFVEYDNNWP